MRVTVLDFTRAAIEHDEFTDNVLVRLPTFLRALVQYAGLLAWPWPLRVERQMPWAHSLFEWDVALGGLLAASMLTAIFKYWRKRPMVSFGLGWFFIAIVPASNILIPINAPLYEHFLYMPMIGIALVGTGLALELVRQRRWQKPALAVLATILAVFCAINIRRNLDWRTAIGFYEQLVQYAPGYRVFNNLGMEYANKGIYDKAEHWYLKAIAADPQNPVAYHNLAGTYRATGRRDLAEKNFRKAIELDPKFIFSYRALEDLLSPHNGR